MPLLPWKTTERRIGVLGPNWAGKTVFLTSLINHLSSHDSRYFHLGGGRASAEVRKFQRLKEDRGWPGFDYDQHRERLVHRRWPTKTTDCAEFSCRFERSDWTFSDLILKLYDLPGERINDVAMVKSGSDTFETWSDSFVRRIEKDIGYADRFEAYLKRLDDPNLSEEELLHSYKVALGRLRLAYKPYITPSTYALDREGQACRGRDPEELAKERYVGLKPGQEFAPLPREARYKHSQIARKFADRFDAYCEQVVEPLVDGLRSCHSLVVLVDVMRILASDTGTHDDYQELLRDMMRTLNPRENFLKKSVRWVTELLLPHDWRPSWISRIAFVAPKADLVHPEDRNRLKHLLKQMVERDARDCDGIKYDFFNVSAVRATEAVPGGEARRVLTGSTMLDAEGRPVEPGDRQKFVVSPLPDEWPRQWKVGDYVFPSVYPEIPARRGCPPDQIGLDAVFNFLCR
jgi:predicted YcjX-like family ATPase